MPNYLVRKNCEYTLEIVASDAKEAVERAEDVEFKNWGEAWSEMTAELEGPEEPKEKDVTVGIMVKAPWTLSQVLSLQQYQECGVLHEYIGLSGRTLTATENGWVESPNGPVVQDWAYESHTDWTWFETVSHMPMFVAARVAPAKKQAAWALLAMRHQVPSGQWEHAVKKLLGEA